MTDKKTATLIDFTNTPDAQEKIKEIIKTIEDSETLDDLFPGAVVASWDDNENDWYDNLSVRGKEFEDFSGDVIKHIENYTVPQYGDSPNDLVEEWTVQQCIDSAKKYLARHGRNQREGQDELDLIKAAHYIQIAYTKLKK